MQQETGGRGTGGSENSSVEEQPPLDLRFRLEDHTYTHTHPPVIVGYARDLPTIHCRMAIVDPDGRLELVVIDRETEERVPYDLILVAVQNWILEGQCKRESKLSHKVNWAKEGF